MVIGENTMREREEKETIAEVLVLSPGTSHLKSVEGGRTGWRMTERRWQAEMMM